MSPAPRNQPPAQPAPDAPPAEPTAPPSGDEAPPWAVELMTTIRELPAKLRATITDDDRRGIAEHVHGLFERSGAFEKPPAGDEPPGDDEPEPPANPEPEPAPGRDSWARRVFGPH